MRADTPVLLEDVVDIRNGAGIKQTYFTQNGVPLVKVSNLTDNSVDTSNLTQVCFEHAKKWESHRLIEDDVIIATVGSWPPNWSSVVGKVIRVPKSADGMIQNQNTACIKAKASIIDNDYLYYLLKNSEFLQWVSNTAQGSANQARIAVKQLGKYPFFLPEMSVQKSIGSLLKSLDKKIETNRQINLTLEQIAQAIFKSWFVDFEPVKAKIAAREALIAESQAQSGKAPSPQEIAKVERQAAIAAIAGAGDIIPTAQLQTLADLFPNQLVESELGEMPEGWSFSPFSKIAQLKKGKNITKKSVVEGSVPVVAGGLKPAYFHNCSNVAGPTITISASGANAGFVNLYFEDIWASDCSFLNFQMTEFIYFCYTALKVNQKKITDMQTGAAQPHIYPKDFDRLIVAEAPRELIATIENIFSNLFKKIANNKDQINVLSDLRDVLLPKLLTGEIELTNKELM
ncbi:restriction endonuclease subunit S [Pseudoalteromonas lipolytica]